MIESMFQRESIPVLDASIAFAMQQHKVISNNIANVNTPHFKRGELNDGEFRSMLIDAIEERAHQHPAEFRLDSTFDIDTAARDTIPVADRLPGMDHGPERHDENNVVIEREMVDLAKNTGYIETMQRLLKKKYTMLQTAISERVA